jgi:hypothetical protein
VSRKLAKRLIEPDFWTCPHGKRVRPVEALTYGPEVAEVCADAGMVPDPQQELSLDLIFAINPDGTPVTFEYCLICSRQNMKTGVFLMAAVGWIYVLDEPEIMWSAHELSTSLGSQEDLANLIRGSATLRKRMLPQKNDGVYETTSSERIELRNPETGQTQTIWYKARTRDGARGLAKKKLVLDEGFALRWAMMGAIIPVMLAQVGAQVLIGSSPGKADAEVLHDMRERGRKGMTPRMTYLEWGAPKLPPCPEGCTHPKPQEFTDDAACSANRLDLILRANPTAVNTERMPVANLLNTRHLLSYDEWIRECMGQWEEPDGGIGAVFGPGRWEACARQLEDDEKPESPAAIGVAVSVDRTWASIAAATPVEVVEDPEDTEAEPVDRIFVAAVDRREGVEWLFGTHRVGCPEDCTEHEDGELKRLQDEHPDAVFLMDEKDPGASLIPALEDRDVAVETIDLDEYTEACARFFDKVRSRFLMHPSSEELDAAIGGAVWRPIGERQVWGMRQALQERGREISMLKAATVAVYGAEKFGSFGIY